METTGLVLSTVKILPNTGKDLFNAGYRNIAISHSKGLYNVTAESIFDEIGNKIYPLKIIGSSHLIDNDEFANKKIQSNLSLPTLLKITDHPLFYEYTAMIYRFANIIAKADNHISKEEEIKLKEIYHTTHNPILEDVNKSLIVNTDESIEEVLEELNCLIGLNGVKQEINTLINYIKVTSTQPHLARLHTCARLAGSRNIICCNCC